MYYQAIVSIISEIDTKNGVKEKKLKKYFLVNAVNVSDAELKINKTFEKTTINFEVNAVIESKISEIIK